MKMSRYLAVLVAVAVFVSPAAGKTAPPVLKQIPAGSVGFMMVNNVKGTAARVEQFMTDIGVGAFIPRGGTLATIQGAMGLGEGFNPDGGLAVTMLDPQQFGLDLVGLMTGKPGVKQPAPRDIPVVFFVAGSGVKEVFGPMAKPAGKYFHIMIPIVPAPCFAIHRNGYVVISPCRAAVDAVAAAKKTALDEIAKAHAATLGKSDVAFYLNMRVVGPIAKTALRMFEQMAGPMGGGMGGPMDMAAVLAFYRELLSDMDGITIAASLEAKGVAADFVASFTPDSPFSKIAAAFPGTIKPSVDRLANLPYVMAISSVVENSPEARKFGRSMTDKLFGKGMPKPIRDMIAQMQNVMSSEQISAIQFVAGGAPQGSGVFGVAAVIECKDTKVVKKMLAGGASTIEALIKNMEPNNEDLQKLKIAYVNNVATTGSIAVDAIAVTHPEMDDMSEGERAMMKKILGEDKILVRVAAADNKTVVVTIGGSAAFLDESIKAAKVGGRIVSRKDAKALAGRMPEKPNALMLISVGNLFEVIDTGMRAIEPAAGGMPIKVNSKEPIVISGGYTGKASHTIVYVPTKLVKEVIDAVKPFLGMMMTPPGGGKAIPPGDF